jgi:hypothetical protein
VPPLRPAPPLPAPPFVPPVLPVVPPVAPLGWQGGTAATQLLNAVQSVLLKQSLNACDIAAAFVHCVPLDPPVPCCCAQTELQSVVAVAVLASAWHIASLMQISLQDGVDELEPPPHPCTTPTRKPTLKIALAIDIILLFGITRALLVGWLKGPEAITGYLSRP